MLSIYLQENPLIYIYNYFLSLNSMLNDWIRNSTHGMSCQISKCLWLKLLVSGMAMHHGCYFHYCQSLYKQIELLDLSAAYLDDDDTPAEMCQLSSFVLIIFARVSFCLFLGKVSMCLLSHRFAQQVQQPRRQQLGKINWLYYSKRNQNSNRTSWAKTNLFVGIY